jgi:hypothetical protein
MSSRALAQNEPVVLEVSGQIEQSRTFTLSELAALGTVALTTSTAWTAGSHDFEGVLVRDVLAAVGPTSSTIVTAIALNDYQADIPISDFLGYDVILAWSMDGVPMTRRDKGPLWIVYPRDTLPELQDERYEHRWVWQLNRLLLP